MLREKGKGSSFVLFPAPPVALPVLRTQGLYCSFRPPCLFPADLALPPSFPIHPPHSLYLRRVCSVRYNFRNELINSLTCNILGLFVFLETVNELTLRLRLLPSLLKLIEDKMINKQKVKVNPVKFSATGKWV